MYKMQKIISIVLILTIITSILLSIINQNKSYAVTQSTSTDINSIDDSKYPGIKERIKLLKSKYPNWNFKILYTGLDWNDVISNEYVGHGRSPKNLVYKNDSYKGAWICSICGDKAYDNGNWRCVSEQGLKYMMDPRNSLNASDIFQFEELTNSGSDINVVKEMVKGTFLAGYEQGIVDAANKNNVNAYYIVARIIQEQGKTGTVLTKGEGYKGQYVGYYNVFNRGASGNSTEEILLNGLAIAKKYGWTSLEKSIDGGISFLANNYIHKGQNNLYLQKFDVEATNGLYSNQYMQNILAAQSEGTTLRNTYININSMSSSHTFIIPVYENMPSDACSRPDTNGSSSSDIDVVRVNVDETLRIRNNPNGTKTVGWLYKNEIVTRLEKATSKVNGTYWDKIRNSNGVIGYVARETYENEKKYKLYLVPINENNNSGDNGNNNGNNNSGNNDNNNNGGNSSNIKNEGKDTLKVKFDRTNNIITVVPNAIANDILEAFGGTAKITKANGSFLNGPSDSMATGFIVEDKYTVVKKGDCNGDGNTNALDAAIILRYNVNQYNLKDCYFKAGAISDNNNATALDAAKILRYSVGQYNIEL